MIKGKIFDLNKDLSFVIFFSFPVKLIIIESITYISK